jgi:hypothetical protein
MSSKFQIPIQASTVKKRAQQKLNEMKAQKRSVGSATKSVSENIVKPVRVSKDDPSVKRMLGHL